jgi:hypothetical protein
LIETIAMTGSPATRGAAASADGAGRAFFAAAWAVSGASATTMANATMVRDVQRRIEVD